MLQVLYQKWTDDGLQWNKFVCCVKSCTEVSDGPIRLKGAELGRIKQLFEVVTEELALAFTPESVKTLYELMWEHVSDVKEMFSEWPAQVKSNK